ncbi:class I SAM-dependent methyltransferase [Fusibacter ferrireducens]|uniref:Methyltransferase type 11 domain-containing protein n=1 Tax=Fusibacter ferrireducens TaxID=2785058 RepID=A0ABR9ZV47_9FIRM|nr:methyltransferase domain-containing protein [Fusibacter ferrireducens]MBF4693765.1 hypothetical protein [Fusibacter ferrireducens]
MKLIIGAGNTQVEGWISTQEDELNILNFENWESLFEKSSIDSILAEHVWEHLSFEDGIKAAKNCYTFLKPFGRIRCAVPDKNFKNEWYQNMVQVGGPGSKDHPAYTHKILYDYKKLKEVFEKAGFTVLLLEYCDEHNNFHYIPWNEEEGKIGRSYRFDTRNTKESLGMVSIIIDAYKPMVINQE